MKTRMQIYSRMIVLTVGALISTSALPTVFGAPVVSVGQAVVASGQSGNLVVTAKDTALSQIGDYIISLQVVPEVGSVGSINITSAFAVPNALYSTTPMGFDAGNGLFVVTDASSATTPSLSPNPVGLFGISFNSTPNAAGVFDIVTYLNGVDTTDPLSSVLDDPTASPIPSVTFTGGTIQVGQVQSVVWAGGTGVWGAAAKWTGGAVPTNTTAEVQIDNGNVAASVVTLDQNVTVSDIVLDANDTLNINANKTLTLTGSTATALNGTLNNSGTISGSSITVGLSGSFTLATGGSLSLSGTFTNQGTTVLGGIQNWGAAATFANAAGTATFGSDAGTGAANLHVNVSGGNIIFASTQHLSSLTIGSAAVATVTRGTSAQRSIVVTPAISVAGTLDLTNNDIDIPAGDLTILTPLIKQGFNNSSGHVWSGTGITSSTAMNDPTQLTALGIALGSVVPSGNVDGQPVSPSDVLIRYTYYGDADLSGAVTGNDYTLIDNGFNSQGGLTGWQNGDFNYDGVIDGSDYSLIDNAFNRQGASLPEISTAMVASTVSAVPEPSTLTIAILSLSAAGSRRRGASRYRRGHNQGLAVFR